MARQLRALQKANFALVGGFSQDLRTQVSPATTYNYYVSIPTDGKQPPVLLPNPGLRLSKTFDPGLVGRKQYVYQNYMFCVVSQYVYRVDSALNYSKIGELGTNEGPVGISGNNNNEVIFVDGASGWIYNTITGAWTEITDSNFPIGCISIDYLDGYFITVDPDSNQIFLSELNDGFTWPVDNVGAMQRQPNALGVGVAVIKGIVLFFSKTATEAWFDAGGQVFPLARDNNALYKFGCIATGSISENFDKLFWLGYDDGGTPGVLFCDGGTPVRVSTHEVEKQFSTYSDLSDAIGQVFEVNGYIFYQISFTNATWLFNEEVFYKDPSKAWSLLGDSDFDPKIPGQINGSRHLMQSHAFFAGKNYVLAYNSPKLFEMDPFYDYYDDAPIMRMRISHKFFDPAHRLIRVAQFIPVMIMGVGNANNDAEQENSTRGNANPIVELRVSYDGAENWSKPRQAVLGKMGKTQGRIIFYELGIAESFTFMLICWNAVDATILDAAMMIDVVGV